MQHIKPQSTEEAKLIFQDACNIENMPAKLGRTLLAEENDIRRFILSQSPVLGRIPNVDEIRRSFAQLPRDSIDAILNTLDQVDAIHLAPDRLTIAAAYPFSGFETAHLVNLKKVGFKEIYAMCAIDALGISFMFGCDTSIDSRCHHCGERIGIEIENNEIVALQPEDITVWCDMEYCDCAATSLCKNINFFSSTDHFAAWQKEKPRRKGELLQIGEALYLGKVFFEKRLEE